MCQIPTEGQRVHALMRVCEPGDWLTFTALAESITKSNQGMLAWLQNQIMPGERSLVVVKLGQRVQCNSINRLEHKMCALFKLY